jgi:A118 family predicted phage portal protein
MTEDMHTQHTPSSVIDVMMQLWLDMYMGCPPWLSDEVHTLNLPELIVAKFARYATAEMQSDIKGDVRIVTACERLIDRATELTEYALVGGSAVIKPVAYPDGSCAFDIIKPGWFRITQTDQYGDVIGCDFASEFERDEKIYTKLERHVIENGSVRVTNQAYVRDAYSASRVSADARFTEKFVAAGKEIPLTDVPEWSDVVPEYVFEGVSKPLFAVLRPRLTRTGLLGSSYGASIFAPATQLIEEADRQYSRFLWELESANRALYVSQRAIRPDRSDIGSEKIKRMYRTLDSGVNDNMLFEDWTPNIRVVEQTAALDEILAKIELSVGLSLGTLSRVTQSTVNAKTAAEINAMKQDTYTTVVDLQTSLERALTGAGAAMERLLQSYGYYISSPSALSFEFDDSIVSDRTVAFNERLQLLSASVITPEEFRVWYFGESPEDASAVLSELRSRTADLFAGADEE